MYIHKKQQSDRIVSVMTDKEQTGVQMGLVGDNKEALLPAD